MVTAASAVFLVFMIPRGVLIALNTEAYDWPHTKTYWIYDEIAFELQYLNHSTNFFIYVVANDSFR